MDRGTSQQKPLAPDVQRTVRRYCQALRRADIPVQEVLVFGSQAKGTAREHSDIDLAVVSGTFGKDYHDELGMLMKVRDQDMLEIEPHPFHPDDLNNRWSTLASEVRRYGISIE
jgi:uncharacterized protein